jgi:hypothetical protein
VRFLETVLLPHQVPALARQRALQTWRCDVFVVVDLCKWNVASQVSDAPTWWGNIKYRDANMVPNRVFLKSSISVDRNSWVEQCNAWIETCCWAGGKLIETRELSQKFGRCFGLVRKRKCPALIPALLASLGVYPPRSRSTNILFTRTRHQHHLEQAPNPLPWISTSPYKPRYYNIDAEQGA